jgi:hypothetical protein
MDELMTDNDIEQSNLESSASRKRRKLHTFVPTGCDLCQADCEARFFHFGMPICDKCQYKLLERQGRE